MEQHGAPSEAERSKALELCVSEPALLARAVDLVRLAVAEKTDSRIRSALRAWASELIRSRDPELQDWGRFGGVSPEGELSLLAKLLLRVRKGKGDRDAEVAAEQVLRVGLAVTATRTEFDAAASLFSVFEALHPARPDRRDLGKKVRAFALNASPTLIENLAALVRLVRFETDPIREEVADLRSRLQAARDRATNLQQQCDIQAKEVEVLANSNEELRQTLNQAERKIDGVMGGADHDMLEFRARVRTLLTRKLKPNLDEARDGLDHDPPHVEVARHRLGAAEREIGKELEWLNQFSD